MHTLRVRLLAPTIARPRLLFKATPHTAACAAAVAAADGARLWVERLHAAGLRFDEEEEEWEDAGDDEGLEDEGGG